MQMTAHEEAKHVRAIAPDNHPVSTVNGAGIDCRTFREALFAVDVGAIGGGATIDFKVQDSDDDGASDPYGDVSGAVITQIAVANRQALIRVNCEQTKRFLRGVLTISTAAADAAVAATLSHAEQKPVTQDAAEVVNVHS